MFVPHSAVHIEFGLLSKEAHDEVYNSGNEDTEAKSCPERTERHSKSLHEGLQLPVYVIGELQGSQGFL